MVVDIAAETRMILMTEVYRSLNHLNPEFM